MPSRAVTWQSQIVGTSNCVFEEDLSTMWRFWAFSASFLPTSGDWKLLSCTHFRWLDVQIRFNINPSRHFALIVRVQTTTFSVVAKVHGERHERGGLWFHLTTLNIVTLVLPIVGNSETQTKTKCSGAYVHAKFHENLFSLSVDVLC
jgi:hypothetical protein